MIASMDRIEIVFMRSELDAMIGFLQEQGNVHLEQVPLALEDHPGYLHRVHLPEDERAELTHLEEYHQLLRETTPLLSVRPTYFEIASTGQQLEESLGNERITWARGRDISVWHRHLRRLHRRKLNIEDNIVLVENYSITLQQILPVLQSHNARLGQNATALMLDDYSEEGLDELQGKLRQAAPRATFRRHPVGKDRVILVIVHPEDQYDGVSEVLETEGIRAFTSPDGEVTGNTPVEVMERAGAKLTQLRDALASVTSEIASYSSEHGAEIMALEQMVSNRVKQLSVTDDFAQSRLIAAAQGWIPSVEFDAFKSAMKTKFGDRAEVGTLSTKDLELDRIPTKLVNHPIVKPFELVMKSLMKPPTYGHFDPTSLVMFSFLLFFGYVLGDFGYGLTMIGIGWLVKRKFGHIEMLADVMTLLQYMGISTCIFGIWYFEMFGSLLIDLFGWPGFPFFHREYEPNTALAIAVALGAIHVTTALVIGIRESFAHGHRKHGEELLGMLLGVFALFVALGTGALLPAGLYTLGMIGAAILFAAAVFYLFKSMGAMGLMGVVEIVGLFANILSYSRLMALGVAGIAFANLANEITKSAAGVFLLFAFLGTVGVHLFNFVLHVFSPTIHSLRLNVVEFLPKFYHPEGRNYEPFRKDMAW